MLVWIGRILILVAGPLISYFQISHSIRGVLIGLAGSLLVILIELIIHRIPLDTLIAAIIGTIMGLIGAKLLDYTVYLMDNQKIYEWMRDYSLLIKVVLAYLGLVIAVRKKSELDLLDRDILKRGRRKRPGDLIVLDTSAIIDGRIADIVGTRFISGMLLVPRFILAELQTLADSSDAHKRNRARRGLDIIAQLQKEESVTIKIVETDYPELKEADAKLLQLAKELEAKIITTDFNLNKVAALQGVTVLNINDLSNALKPVYLPGELMPIFVVKEGKEHHQGVGYLDDGTMVIIEEGRKHVGKRIDVMVTSILQTSSGRMVFTRPASERDAREGRDIRENREGREVRENREVREVREGRDGRDNRDTRDNRDHRERRDGREGRPGRDNREAREHREPRENREARENREPRGRDNREPRENREAREPKDIREDLDGGGQNTAAQPVKP